ncbi:hypothetical protein L1887_56525 [Cichorium endivia]|nr:hypothetical protein L1887_56525 [Cichorium endivia]
MRDSQEACGYDSTSLALGSNPSTTFFPLFPAKQTPTLCSFCWAGRLPRADMDESQRDSTTMAAVMSCSSLEASERRVSSRIGTAIRVSLARVGVLADVYRPRQDMCLRARSWTVCAVGGKRNSGARATGAWRGYRRALISSGGAAYCPGDVDAPKRSQKASSEAQAARSRLERARISRGFANLPAAVRGRAVVSRTAVPYVIRFVVPPKMPLRQIRSTP